MSVRSQRRAWLLRDISSSESTFSVAKVEQLQSGRSPIVEPGMTELVAEGHHASQHLLVATRCEPAKWV
jgi:UDP-glucose 6-dehydrogenase